MSTHRCHRFPPGDIDVWGMGCVPELRWLVVLITGAARLHAGAPGIDGHLALDWRTLTPVDKDEALMIENAGGPRHRARPGGKLDNIPSVVPAPTGLGRLNAVWIFEPSDQRRRTGTCMALAPGGHSPTHRR